MSWWIHEGNRAMRFTVKGIFINIFITICIGGKIEAGVQKRELGKYEKNFRTASAEEITVMHSGQIKFIRSFYFGHSQKRQKINENHESMTSLWQKVIFGCYLNDVIYAWSLLKLTVETTP